MLWQISQVSTIALILGPLCSIKGLSHREDLRRHILRRRFKDVDQDLCHLRNGASNILRIKEHHSNSTRLQLIKGLHSHNRPHHLQMRQPQKTDSIIHHTILAREQDLNTHFLLHGRSNLVRQ